MNTRIFFSIIIAALFFGATSCSKKTRPALGDFPKDPDPHFPLFPGGPLKFYTAFDGTSTDKLMNAVDSVRANFPTANPLASVAGISKNGIQGNGSDAIRYASANDFNLSTSCTISMWVNNTVNANTELYFSLVDKDYWHASSAFLLVEHATPTACTFKFALQDHWVEYTNQSFTRPLFNGQWHHLAFVYDEATSKLTIYFDGAAVPPPAGSTGDLGLGQLNLKNASGLVVGGWNKHAGIEGPTDAWISGFTGKMDQFRLYGKALTASEILALYNSKL